MENNVGIELQASNIRAENLCDQACNNVPVPFFIYIYMASLFLSNKQYYGYTRNVSRELLVLSDAWRVSFVLASLCQPMSTFKQCIDIFTQFKTVVPSESWCTDLKITLKLQLDGILTW